MSLLCRLNIHQTRKVQRHGTVRACKHCPYEKRLTWAAVPNPDFVGRQLTRKRTKGER